MADDSPPLLFRKVLGGLRPANRAAEEAIAEMGDQTVRVRITRTTGNVKRLRFYWACVGITVDNLSDRVEGGILTTKAMHKKLKRDLGLAKPIVSKKTGEIIDWDYDSISFDKMPELERIAFVDAALAKMSGWLGCDVADLRSESEIAA